MSTPFTEKRQHPRIAESLSLKLRDNEEDIFTQTQNISCSGAYCLIDRDIPIMTKLAITLMLPPNGATTGKTSAAKKISCTGVVVRSEPALPEKDEMKTCYSIAIFFTDISKHNLDNLSTYINKRLSTTAEKK